MKSDINYSMSAEDIEKIFKHFGFDVAIITYDDLLNYNSFNEILKDNISACILHIPQNILKTDGHWCAIMRKQEKDKNIICFYDSFGKKPDRQLYYTNKKIRSRVYDEPYLSYILNNDKKSNYDVIFNSYEFQNSNTATCGKWCIYRILYFFFTKDISNNSFLKHICDINKKYYKQYSKDQMIALLMNPDNPKYI